MYSSAYIWGRIISALATVKTSEEEIMHYSTGVTDAFVAG